jgi:O-antigen/teichoic acid export membrane protein
VLEGERSTRRNVVANLAGRAWSILAVYLFLPLYLRLLGAEAYGVVGFFAVLQGLMLVADLGLTATLNRELARLGALNQAARARDTARTIEVPYLVVAGILGIAVAGAAPWIAGRWLVVRSLPVEEVTAALRLMGLALALQFPAGLYHGGLLGLERQVAGNLLQIGWGVTRSGGAVLVLALGEPTLRAFFLWQVGANAAYFVVVRALLWHSLPPAAGGTVSGGVLREVWRYAAGMAAMAALSTLFIQLDKLVISRLMPLESFGFYTLAAAISQVPLVLATPVAAAFFPRLTGMAARGDEAGLRETYRLACQLVGVIAGTAALALGFFASEVLLLWTGSQPASDAAGSAARLLLAGSLAAALQVMPYHLALAAGWVRLNVVLSAAAVASALPLLILLVPRLGLDGGGLAWMLINTAVTFPLVVLVHRRALPGATGPWLREAVMRPLGAATLLLAAVRFGVPLPAGGIALAAALSLAGLAALLAALATSPLMLRYLRRSDATRGGGR